jgi:hypothetical protein
MKPEAWTELLVATVILGGLRFLIVKVIDVNDRESLGSTEHVCPLL